MKDKRIQATLNDTESVPPYLKLDSHKANFLWLYEDGSVEQAGYELVNASALDYRKIWSLELISRIRE